MISQRRDAVRVLEPLRQVRPEDRVETHSLHKLCGNCTEHGFIEGESVDVEIQSCDQICRAGRVLGSPSYALGVERCHCRQVQRGRWCKCKIEVACALSSASEVCYRGQNVVGCQRVPTQT